MLISFSCTTTPSLPRSPTPSARERGSKSSPRPRLSVSRSQIQRAESPPTYKHIALLKSFFSRFSHVPDLYLRNTITPFLPPSSSHLKPLSLVYIFPTVSLSRLCIVPILFSFFSFLLLLRIFLYNWELRHTIPGLEARGSRIRIDTRTHTHIPPRVTFFTLFFSLFVRMGSLTTVTTHIPRYLCIPQKKGRTLRHLSYTIR